MRQEASKRRDEETRGRRDEGFLDGLACWHCLETQPPGQKCAWGLFEGLLISTRQ